MMHCAGAVISASRHYIQTVTARRHVTLLAILLAGLFVSSRIDSTATQDADGVEMLYPSAPGGSSFRLGGQNPNNDANLMIEKSTAGAVQIAMPQSDGALHYWNLKSYRFTYASTGEPGWTSRVHIFASGGTRQLYTWKTQHGYLYSPADVRNQEFTVYVRIHGVLDAPHEAITLKIRGGAHTASDGDLASCTMMTFEPGGRNGVTRFRKELVHPNYDSVILRPQFPAALLEGQWYGLKLVSYELPGDSSRVVNRLYLDVDPIDFAVGKPKNNWRLFSEYIDVEGQKLESSGQYSKLVDWGGWQTTLRTDGINDLDFAFLSVREILPSQPRRRAIRH